MWWPDEDIKNKEIAKKSSAKYFWVYSFKEFIWIMDLVDIIVTQVTFALHVAIWLWKKIILMNNIFNKHEFYFYDCKYELIEPNVWCTLCFKKDFDKQCEVKNCMELIKPNEIFKLINKLNNE